MKTPLFLNAEPGQTKPIQRNAKLGTVALVGVLGLFGLALWDWSGLDIAVAQWSFDPLNRQFMWRSHWLLTTVLHTAIKNALWLLVAYVLFAAVAPTQWRSRLPALGKLPRSSATARNSR